MCVGFGVIIDKTLNLHFIEPDINGKCNHTPILNRLGWNDNEDAFNRTFVRWQFPDWTPESFGFDEDETLPTWVEENRQEIIDKCIKLLGRVAPARAEYEKARAPAWTEYEKVRDAAYAEYVKVRDAAYAEYVRVCDAAWTECEKVCAPVGAEYEKVRDTAWAEMVDKLSSIAGYVPGK